MRGAAPAGRETCAWPSQQRATTTEVPHKLPVKTLVSASIGNAVEWFDWTVYATFVVFFAGVYIAHWTFVVRPEEQASGAVKRRLKKAWPKAAQRTARVR